jgi:TonB family protein
MWGALTMLPWQRPKFLKTLCPKDHFFIRIFLWTTLAHALLVILVFFVYRQEGFVQQINFVDSATVLFLPFQKSIMQKQGALSRTSSGRGINIITAGSARQRTLIGQSSRLVNAEPKTTLVESERQPSGSVNKAKKRRCTIMQQSKKQRKKEILIKKAMLEKVPMIKEKEELVKKPVKEKPLLAKPQVPVPALPVQSEAVDMITSSTEDVSVICVGQLDLDALELQQTLKDRLIAVWRPPRGVPSGRVCKVKVTVDWQGKVQDITIEESSKVIMFDTSVRHAVRVLEFPQGTWGKIIILPFRS